MNWKIKNAHRRILAGESGATIKDWGAKIPVALVFPASYRAGMSNLGLQSVYELFNQESDVVCERFFLPDRGLMAEYERTGGQLLSLESSAELKRFEIVAFSVSFENDYPAVVRLLRMGRLAPRWVNRGEADSLVIGGGVALRSNPEPLAEFFDLVLLGDGEVLIPPFLEAWREAREGSLPKEARLLRLARDPGVYYPRGYQPGYGPDGGLVSFAPREEGLPARVVTQRAGRLENPPVSVITTKNTEFADTRLVEIGRGCGRGCRFCLAGFEYRPPRPAALKDILARLGADGMRVGLVSPAVLDHPGIEELLVQLARQGREITVSSLRAESLTPAVMSLLARAGLRSAAIAPEAGSQRLRDIINKDLCEPQILEAAAFLAEQGLKKLKLYFMIGLPGEKDEDLDALSDLAIRIHAHLLARLKNKKLMPELTLTISSFVPKPGTPFETEPFAGVAALKAKARRLKAALAGIPGLRAHFDAPKGAYLQAVFSRGDRRLAPLIEALAEPGGELGRAKEAAGLDLDGFALGRFAKGELTPWAFIDRGMRPGYLERQRKLARQGRTSPPCPSSGCAVCGVCAEPRPA